jgi:hypothetical protein
LANCFHPKARTGGADLGAYELSGDPHTFSEPGGCVPDANRDPGTAVAVTAATTTSTTTTGMGGASATSSATANATDGASTTSSGAANAAGGASNGSDSAGGCECRMPGGGRGPARGVSFALALFGVGWFVRRP